MSDQPKVGDYVLATKYEDGDPCDHFFVGVVTGYTTHMPPRFMVADKHGNNQRGNGFRRAEVITHEEGHQLVAMMPEIGDRPGPSVWSHLDTIRKPEDVLHLPYLSEGVPRGDGFIRIIASNGRHAAAIPINMGQRRIADFIVQACNSYHRRALLMEQAAEEMRYDASCINSDCETCNDKANCIPRQIQAELNGGAS